MIINKIFSGTDAVIYQDNLSSTEQGNTRDPQAQQDNTTLSNGPASVHEDTVSISDVWAVAARDINVRDASPRDILRLSNQLYQASAISYDDHLSLSFQPEINLDTQSESKPFSHDQKDYIALWQAKEQNVIRFGGDRSQIEDTHRIQAILTYVDSLKS